jgi:transcriptional regulator with XRE-family HTH domain
MSDGRSPVAEEFGRRLRRLRVEAGKSGVQVANDANVTQPTVSKVERGQLLPGDDVFARLADALGLAPATRDELTELLARARDEAAERRRHGRGQSLLTAIAEREHAAAQVRSFQSAMVPALLQTAGYARHAATRTRWLGTRGERHAVQTRLDRQAVLFDEARTFEFVVTESALNTWPGPDSLMPEQIAHIRNAATLPNVRFGIMPARETVPYFPLYGFTIYDDTAVSIETFTGELVLDAPRDVAVYQEVFASFAQLARHDDDADALLDQMLSRARRLPPDR